MGVIRASQTQTLFNQTLKKIWDIETVKPLNQNNLKQQPFKPNRLRIFLAHTKLVQEGVQTIKPLFLGLILARSEL